MTMDAEMKDTYLASLREAERELSGMNDRRRALLATVAALRSLVGGEQLSLDSSQGGESKPDAIPPGFFRGKAPTEAYRQLHDRYPGDYTAPQIVDAFMAGGMEAKSRNSLLAQVHSVRRREKLRAEKNGSASRTVILTADGQWVTP